MPRALAAALIAALVGALVVVPAGEAARGKQGKAKKKKGARGSALLGSKTVTLAAPKRRGSKPRYGRLVAVAPRSVPRAPAPPAALVPSAPAPPTAVAQPPSTDPGEPLGSFASVRARDSATSFSFTLSRSVLAAGPVTLQLQNSGEDPHDLTVAPEGGGAPIAATPEVAPSANATLAATLPAGRYTLYCSIPSHAARGMQASLDVR